MNQGTHDRGFGAGIAALGIALLLAWPLSAWAETAGRVISSVGEVRAIDRQDRGRALSRHDVVYPGDLLVTGARGRAQIRMRDGALIDLKPRSEIEIESYREATADEAGSAVLGFLRGAMRTITGAIGRGGDDEYRMNTPVATVGIRGTDYSLQYCDSGCAGDGREIGLYGRVDDGEVEISNEWGTGAFPAGSYFFVPPDGPPQLLLMPPSGILDGNDDGDANGEDEEADDLPEGVTIGPVDEDDGDIDLGVSTGGDEFRTGEQPRRTGVTGMVGSLVTFANGQSRATTTSHTGGDGFDASNGIVQAADFDATGGFVSPQDASLVEVTSFDDLGVVTGRWTGLLSIDEDGDLQSDFGDFAFAWTDNLTSPDQFAGFTGSASYSYAGGPSASDINGNLWTVGGMDLAVDFGDQTADISNFILTDNQLVLDLEGSATTIGSTFQVFVSDDVNAFGTVDAQFVGLAEGVIAAFELVPLEGDLESAIAGTAVLTLD